MLNKAEIDKKRKAAQEQESEVSGWDTLRNKASDQTYTTSSLAQEKKGLLSAQPTAGATKDQSINFSRKGAPQFTNSKNKKRIDEDFPEMDASAAKTQAAQGDDSEVSKKDQANIGFFSGQPKGARTDQPAQTQVEERKEASKPIFTSSKKKGLNLGGDRAEDIMNSKQNYDFSGLRMASAKEKKPFDEQQKPNEGQGQDQEDKPEEDKPRQQKAKREYNDAKQFSRASEQPAAEVDEDFVTV